MGAMETITLERGGNRKAACAGSGRTGHGVTITTAVTEVTQFECENREATDHSEHS